MANWKRVLTTASDGILPVANGGTGAADTSTARDNLGLEIAVDVQAYSGYLQGIHSAGAPTDSNILVGNGSAWVKESGADARTSLGVDVAGTDNSTNVTLANTNYLSISGQAITGGTVPVGSGGTGATSASAARANLGLTLATAGVQNGLTTIPNVNDVYDFVVVQGYTTNTGTTTASNSQTFTNKAGNISQWTNNSGYSTATGVANNADVTGSNICARPLTTNAQTIAGAKTFSSALTASSSVQLSDGQQVQWGGGDNAIFGHDSSNYVKIKTNSSDRMTINSSGNTTFSGTVTGTTFIGALTGNVTGNSTTTSETTITNLQATAITANSLKTSNVTHTGNVTGSTALTISDNVITGDMLTTGAIDHPSKLAADVVGSAAIGGNAVGASELNVSGNGTTSQFLRSDADGTMTWATPTVLGTVTSGTWNAGVIASAYLDADTMHLSGSQTVTGSKSFSAADMNIVIQNDTGSNAGTTNIFQCQYQGSAKFSVKRLGYTYAASLGIGTAASTTTGEIRATNEVTAYYSDDRLKTKSGNIKNALDKVISLNGFHYQPNELAGELGYDTSVKKVGVSAQEVLKVLPEAVVPAPIDPKYHTVQYNKLIPLLIESIKELTAKVTRLENGDN